MDIFLTLKLCISFNYFNKYRAYNIDGQQTVGGLYCII
jgi:hypothetical protein